MQEDVKHLVRAYWDAVPCGTRNIKCPEGSMEYYESISKNRYGIEFWIPQFAEFSKWAGKSILEVGCGVGSDLVEFAKQGAIVTGIDLSPHSARLANQRLLVYGLNGRVIEGDAESLVFYDNTFDLVYSNGVLHHTPNTEKAIGEIYRVLKPNGEIRVMLYHKYSLVSLQAYLWFGLFRLRPFQSISKIMSDNMESAGTKVYTIGQVKQMFSLFKNLDVRTIVTSHDIRYARDRYMPELLRHVVPSCLGWNILIRGTK